MVLKLLPEPAPALRRKAFMLQGGPPGLDVRRGCPVFKGLVTCEGWEFVNMPRCIRSWSALAGQASSHSRVP